MTTPSSDLPARLAALHGAAFDVGWSRDELERLLAMPGAEVEAGPDGFILWRAAADEAEVITLAVHPSARRRGVGGRLLDGAVARAARDGAARMILEVAEDNAAALVLYGSRGFQAVGRRPAYYARPDGTRAGAVILALNLT